MEETTNQRVLVLADLEALENEHDKTNAFLIEHSSAILDVANFEIGQVTENDKVLLYLCDSTIKPTLPKLAKLGCAIGFLPHPEAIQHGLAIKFPKILKRLLKSC